MGFQLGNQAAKGKGRPKRNKTVNKEFSDKHPYAYEEMMEILYNKAKLKNDSNSALAVIERLRGKATVKTEAAVLGVIISLDDLKRQVLELGGIDVQRQRLTEGSPLIEESNSKPLIEKEGSQIDTE